MERGLLLILNPPQKQSTDHLLPASTTEVTIGGAFISDVPARPASDTLELTCLNPPAFTHTLKRPLTPAQA